MMVITSNQFILYTLKDIIKPSEMFCNYRGYIKLNRSEFEKDVRALRQEIEKELYGRSSNIDIKESDVTNFLTANRWLLGGFAAGWLLGYGIA
ncbi:hypothetical protein WR25_10561 [Diploscapter pachys]|uniref:Uncharacterized protein n=1 Tax=Diploscapter pachys TaxID=2018661 RepID=A0A2A2JTF9_9BILA|nr:hypothetical protein WR25_10561 [Diploscapter pachys]